MIASRQGRAVRGHVQATHLPITAPVASLGSSILTSRPPMAQIKTKLEKSSIRIFCFQDPCHFAFQQAKFTTERPRDQCGNVPKRVWFISSGSAFIIQIKNPKQSCDEAVLVLRHLLSFELKTQSSAGLCAILGHRNLNKAQISQDRHLTWKR